MSDVVIRVENLSKKYVIGRKKKTLPSDGLRHAFQEAISAPFRRLWSSLKPRAMPNNNRSHLNSDDEFWALKDVSFELRRGEVLGVIGRNGAGKSTLLKILSRITEPSVGRIGINGRVASLLEVGTGFHPELTGRENIFLNGAVLGMKRIEVIRKFDEIVEFSGAENFLDTPVKRYSTGMYVRLAFAVAAHLEPEILIVDEVLAVGDMAFQKKCLGRIGQVASSGRAVLFVSHNMASVEALATSVLTLGNGRTLYRGNVKQGVANYSLANDAKGTSSLETAKHEGDGSLRITRFEIADEDSNLNVLRCGCNALLKFFYSGDSESLKNISFALGFYNSQQHRVAWINNQMSGFPLELKPRHGVIACRIPKLPLVPGTYSINIHCTVNGSLADRIADAAQFEVIEADFYGTGKMPDWGYICMEQTWSAS